jgi:ribonuclease J
MKMALLLTRLKDDIHLTVPDVLHDGNILVYKKRKKTGAFDEKDYYKWERPYVEKAVDHKFVHDKQSKLIFAIEPNNFTELIDIRPEPGGQYIYSMSEPHSELEQVDEIVQKNWLTHFGMGLSQIHASGHAPPEALERIIGDVQPKTLIPIHTEHPEKFRDLSKQKSLRIICLKKSEPYDL